MANLSDSPLRRRRSIGEDFNPGEGALNLADIMLVFACGLFAALVSFWNVEFPGVSQVQPSGAMSEMAQTPEKTDITASGSGYNELGIVYQDPATGKMYMVSDSSGEASMNSSESSSTAVTAATNP